jgi:hypothetical protein
VLLRGDDPDAARSLALSFDVDLLVNRGQDLRRVAPPLDEHDRAPVERVFQTQFRDVARIFDAVQIEVIDWRIAFVAMPKRECRTAHLIDAVAGADDRSDKCRFSAAERSGESDRVAGPKALCEVGRKRAKLGLGIECSIHGNGEDQLP